MKKRLNIDQIQSELRGGSAFFPGYKGGSDSSTPPLQEPDPVETTDITAAQSMPRPKKATSPGVPPAVPIPVPQEVPRGVPPAVPLIPKVRRPIRQRQPFDIYEDQYEALKQIAESEREFINGRGMSQMVREALDNYLRDNASSKK